MNVIGRHGRNGFWSSAWPAATRRLWSTCTTATPASSTGSRCGRSLSGRLPRTSPRRSSCRCGSIPERIEPGRGTLRGFLGTLTHRRAVDAVRREEARRRREARVARGAGDVPDVAEAVLRSDTTGKVRAALDVLPDAQRQALELAYFHGYTYRQVADVLGIPEGTAKSRLRLALARIAENLDPEMSERGERWA